MDNDSPKPREDSTTSQSTTPGLFSEKWIKRIVTIYFFLYVTIASLGLLSLLILLLNILVGGTYRPTAEVVVGAIIAIALSGGLSYGLKKRKPWLPFFITLIAGLSIVNGLFFAEKNILFIISLLFNGFGIYFFSSHDVRRYFGAKGHYFI